MGIIRVVEWWGLTSSKLTFQLCKMMVVCFNLIKGDLILELLSYVIGGVSTEGNI